MQLKKLKYKLEIVFMFSNSIYMFIPKKKYLL